MAMIVLIDGEGRQRRRVITAGAASAAAEGENPEDYTELTVEEWPPSFTRYDAGEWVPIEDQHVAAIDAAHLADHGPLSIRFAHAQKALEALMHQNGLDISGGLLAAEATLTGRPLADLATTALARSVDDYFACELARREAKHEARE